MRILAALTLLISALLSPLTTAAPLEVKWEFDIVPNQFLRGSTLRDVRKIYATEDGGCAVRIKLVSPREPTVDRTVLLIISHDGILRWHSQPLLGSPYWVWTSSDAFIYRRTDAVGGGFTFVSVDLESGSETIMPLSLVIDQDAAAYSWSSASFFVETTKADGENRIIQKWAPASPTPNLAPSTFGIEDDNLIISWPTTAGHTYQVQRSTDLESWQNIGVALTGNGTTMSYAQPSTAEKVFLRVVIP